MIVGHPPCNMSQEATIRVRRFALCRAFTSWKTWKETPSDRLCGVVWIHKGGSHEWRDFVATPTLPSLTFEPVTMHGLLAAVSLVLLASPAMAQVAVWGQCTCPIGSASPVDQQRQCRRRSRLLGLHHMRVRQHLRVLEPILLSGTWRRSRAKICSDVACSAYPGHLHLRLPLL
jgi:hypothetical protein